MISRCHRNLRHQPPPSAPRQAFSPYVLAAVGATALGAAYYFFGTQGTAQDTAKELGSTARGATAAVEGKIGLRRGREEYQKVYDKIAEELELEGYDGESATHCTEAKGFLVFSCFVS
jgi:cytochrome c peroxidase